MDKWRCIECNTDTDANERPEKCPTCGGEMCEDPRFECPHGDDGCSCSFPC